MLSWLWPVAFLPVDGVEQGKRVSEACRALQLTLVCPVGSFLWVSPVWEPGFHWLPCHLCLCAGGSAEAPPTHATLPPSPPLPLALWPACLISASPDGIPLSISERTGALSVYPRCMRHAAETQCCIDVHVQCTGASQALSCFSASVLAYSSRWVALQRLHRTETHLASALLPAPPSLSA